MKYEYVTNTAIVRNGKEVPAGTYVSRYRGYDYGLSADDTRAFKTPHISVTFDKEGNAPFFTIPRSYLDLPLESNNASAVVDHMVLSLLNPPTEVRNG